MICLLINKLRILKMKMITKFLITLFFIFVLTYTIMIAVQYIWKLS